jgi:hypothetical protein
MVDLPEMPFRVQTLPRDARGFPVPWFVQWFDNGKPGDPGIGVPDFRVVDYRRMRQALISPRCWVCGGVMGVHRVFVIGPMCAVTKTTSEPPNHRACAEFAAKACPFLTKPRMRRNDKDLPGEAVDAAGLPLDRNPGVVCLYETGHYKPFKAQAGNEGILFRLGMPTQISWWYEGRRATRAEVEHSINSGLPLLEELAKQDGPDALAELAAKHALTEQYFPPVAHEVEVAG